MPDRTSTIDGVRVPRFLYGTARKEDATQRLTALAPGQGFRGIDTANQRRHYHEAAVGPAALEASLAAVAGVERQRAELTRPWHLRPSGRRSRWTGRPGSTTPASRRTGWWPANSSDA